LGISTYCARTHMCIQDRFNPIKLLNVALSNRQAVWSTIPNATSSNLIHLLNLTFIIEDHIQTLITLAANQTDYHCVKNIEYLTHLQTFYSSTELNDESLKKISLQSAI
jgi:hypothetical protein